MANIEKKIQQSTFDDVVRENIVEFDLTPEEALDDAINQFRSQGIDLSNIVKEVSVYNLADTLNPFQHFVASTTCSLGAIIDNETPLFDIIIPALQTIIKECSKDLSYRHLVGENDGYNILMKCINVCSHDEDLLSICLDAFCAFCDGQPDHIDEAGIHKFVLFLDMWSENCTIIAKCIKVLWLNCIKHEGNRELLFNSRIVSKLLSLINLNDTMVITEICKILRIFTLDDDIRVSFGKGVDRARILVNDHNLIAVISGLIKEYKDNQNLMAELMLTLSKFIIRDEYCTQVFESGLLPVFIDSICDHVHNIAVVKSSCQLLKSLAGNDIVKQEIVNYGGPQVIALSFEHYIDNVFVCDILCTLCAALCLRNPQQCPLFVQANIQYFLIQAIKVHLKSENLQKSACMALRNLVSHNRDLAPVILKEGAELALNEALLKHDGKLYQAKIALQDLGCRVSMEEQWTGTMGQISR